MCPGEYAKVTSYGLCGVCVRVNQIHQDACGCEYNEKPFCLHGSQLGIDEDCPDMIIPMPGCYVLNVCEDDGVIEDACVYVEICDHIENPQLVVAAAGVI